MKTTLYLVRHCESEGNACRRNQARFDGVVTKKGLLQAQALAKRFENVPVTAIYSSDAYRCRMTAAPLAAQTGLPVHYRMLLREYTIGAWEGYSIGYTARRFPEMYARWQETPYDHNIPGADPFYVVAERGVAFIRQAVKENPGGTIVAFTHSCTLSCMLTTLFGQPISYYPQIKSGDNTAVTKLEVDGTGHITVVYYNDDSHLPSELCRKNYSGRGASTNMDFEPVRLQEDAQRLEAVVQTMCEEFPKLYTAEQVYGEIRQALAQDDAFAVFPMLLDRTCGLVVMRRDKNAATGELRILYVPADLREIGYCEQAAGEAVDTLRRRGCRYMAVRDTKDDLMLQTLIGRFCFEPMPEKDGMLRMALTVPGCDEPVY